MEDDSLRKSQKWLQSRSKGSTSNELEALTMEGLDILHVQNGLIRCNFVVPSGASDADGNWHVGALATLIDNVAGATVCTVAGHIKVSLDFNISFYSTAKIQEEVEIEAKVVAEKGNLAQVLMEVRRKENKELIALAKQWMASHRSSVKAYQTSKL